jgi:NAD(P)H-quinone oxidoreductase subunit 4
MLSIILIASLMGAIAVGFLPLSGKAVKQTSLTIAIGLFAATIFIATQFDLATTGTQFNESIPWLEKLGLTYTLGVDGLSLPLLVLNGLLLTIAIYISDDDIQRPRLYYSLLLLLNAGVVGAFAAKDLLLFFLFYELELIPLYLLIAIWGGKKRSYAATKFLIYTAISGILILASAFGFVFLVGADNFAYDNLIAHRDQLSLAAQSVLLGGMLLGFGIKMPLVPFHTWLPDAHVEASTPISVLLAGVLLKLGAYGLIRFGMVLFPQAWQDFAPWLAIWAVVSVLYGALNAIPQTDMKRMVAYSSIGHMGFILLAAAASNSLSLLGAMAQTVGHGLISSLLFILVGVVYKKTGTRDIDSLRGLLNPERGLPVIGSLTILGVMASAGLPGMIGFVCEFLIFRGSFPVFPIQTILCIIGTGLTAVYFLLLVNKVFFGRLSPVVEHLPQVGWNDRYPGLILAAAIVILGLKPGWLLAWTEPTTSAIVKSMATIM